MVEKCENFGETKLQRRHSNYMNFSLRIRRHHVREAFDQIKRSNFLVMRGLLKRPGQFSGVTFVEANQPSVCADNH